jgi:aldehyde dehydrogenase (NAD+)
MNIRLFNCDSEKNRVKDMNVSEIFEKFSYGPAPEATDNIDKWLKSHKRKFGHFINGEFTTPSQKLITSKNPATGKALAKVSIASAKDIDLAVDSAQAAFKAWQAQSGHQRARVLYALARIIQKHARALAVLETMDNGKPIRESRDNDIPLVIRHFYHHAGWAQVLDEEFPDHQAHGVVGQIIPWNFPLLMMAWKIAPALAAGNTIVIKPAEFTSLTALYFAHLCQLAGVPKGVINIVTGEGETGQALVKHPKIAKIAFTGSTDVGREIRRVSAKSDKALTLELGGKSPFIVFEDADLDSAIEGLVDAIWFNQGQVCCAGSRLLVQESIKDRFYKKLKKRMAKLRLGDPLDKAIDMGSLIAPIQKQRIEKMLTEGLKTGGTKWQPKFDVPSEGCYLAPTLITDIEPSSPLAQEEIFGPILVAMAFRTPDDAVALANNTRYGLAASIWSENINVALDLAPRIKAGVIWINSTNQFDAACGFGGYRESGFGREGGREGMMAYLKPKFLDKLKTLAPQTAATVKSYAPNDALDETPKLYMAGKQARPDGGYSMPVVSSKGIQLGEVGEGSRKDIRNAVQAAEKNKAWAKSTAHLRAQVIYYIAENLEKRSSEFIGRIRAQTDCKQDKAEQELALSIERLFAAAAMADKFDGQIHSPPSRQLVAAMREPIGIVGVVAPQDNPLLGTITMAAPLLAMGNQVVLVPSDIHPLAATDLYQIFDTSDVPAGAISIITGEHGALGKTLAEHRAVDGLWYFGNPTHLADVKAASAGNLKQFWSHEGKAMPWRQLKVMNNRELLEHATEVKNIWVPYGA